MVNARGATSWLGLVVAWFVILGTTAVVSAAVLVPRIGGGTPYVVMTGSMRPHLPPGTLVVARPVPADRIGVGSVITYQLRSGQAAVVTHRVVSVGVDGRGQRTFVTQGDANRAPDEEPVRPVQVKGERWYSVPYLGYVTAAITGQQRHVALLLVEGALLLYAAAMFGSSLRERVRRSQRAAA
jgi:signal peptidase